MEYSPREFEILKIQNFARVESKSEKFICYGCIVCHSFYENIQKGSGINREKFKYYVSEIIKNINDNSPYKIEDILKIYPVLVNKSEKKIGFMLVDETHGCYPLFFDVEPHVSVYHRLDALVNVLKRIEENYKEIFDLMSSHNNWYEIQQRIIKLMRHI